MSEPHDNRKQWHPVLVDGLRYLMGNRLRIEPEHAVSALPTRIDVLVLSPTDTSDLVSPYHWLAGTTLVELESPGEWATWRSLRKLYADGVLYSLDQGIEPMTQIGLWLITSRISADQLSQVEQELDGLEKVGPGVWRGRFIGSPVTLIHLHELPLNLSALPLLMVYKGTREQEIAEFVLEHGLRHGVFAEQAITFHAHAVEEVLKMRSMNVEAYRQLANVKDIVSLLGPRMLIDEVGKEEFIRTIGEAEVIRTIGEAEVIRTIGEAEVIRTIGEAEFIRTIGRERIRELLEQMDKESEVPPSTPDGD